MTDFLFSDLWNLNLPAPVALAAVAVLGYLWGRRQKPQAETSIYDARREIKRARVVVKELEQISAAIRVHLAQHESSLRRFKEKVGELSGRDREGAWRDLCREAEEILQPTLRLATQVAVAYDEIRQQTGHLMSFTEIRTDPLTGVSNRRALDEMLTALFAMRNRYGHHFSLVIADIDHFKRINDEEGHLTGDHVLRAVAKLLDDGVRETDFVSRYGGEEFVVVLPQTDLAGACIFAQRLREGVERRELINRPLTISVGVAEVHDCDDSSTLLARADAALYAAKSAGRNCVFKHEGQSAVKVGDLAGLVLPEIAEASDRNLPAIAAAD